MLRQEIEERNRRDEKLGMRLRNSHSAIQSALREQHAAVCDALDVIPMLDAVHSSIIRSLAEGARELETFGTLSRPREPHIFRPPAVSLPQHHQLPPNAALRREVRSASPVNGAVAVASHSMNATVVRERAGPIREDYA